MSTRCPVCKMVDPPTTADIDGRTVHAGCPGDHAAWTFFPAVQEADEGDTTMSDDALVSAERARELLAGWEHGSLSHDPPQPDGGGCPVYSETSGAVLAMVDAPAVARMFAAAPDAARAVVALWAALAERLRGEWKEQREYERVEAERDAAREAAAAMREELAALRERVEALTADRDEWQRDANTCDLRADTAGKACDALRAIIEGRAKAPTDEEIDAHHEARGEWLLHVAGVGGIVIDKPSTLRAFLKMDPWRRMWALDADGRPCAWPVVTTEVSDER